MYFFYGADIAAVNTKKQILLADVDMSSPDAKSSIYLTQVEFVASNLTIHDVFYLRSFAAGIYATDLKGLKITDSEFRNLTEYFGGAIYLTQNENSKETLNYPSYNFTSVTFTNCESKRINTHRIIGTQGGSIFLDNTESVSV